MTDGTLSVGAFVYAHVHVHTFGHPNMKPQMLQPTGAGQLAAKGNVQHSSTVRIELFISEALFPRSTLSYWRYSKDCGPIAAGIKPCWIWPVDFGSLATPNTYAFTCVIAWIH